MSAVQSTLLNASFTGRNGIGAISVPGIKVGDVVFFINDPAGGLLFGGGTSPWENIISVDDQLQQVSTTDYSAHTSIKLVVYRGP